MGTDADAIGKWIDRMIGVCFPHWALRRAQVRRAIEQLAQPKKRSREREEFIIGP